MDDPLQEIGPIVHSLCQAPPREQKDTLETYFTEDAAFYHPFCRVDHAPGSRKRLLAIFQWYKIMSPKIELEIESVAYDEIKQILYVTIHQVFSIWFLLGLHNASVVLTTKLQLEKQQGKYYIKSQNDLYQSDQFMKFCTIPWGIGGYFVMAWQAIATFNCIILAHVFSFFTAGLQWYADGGKQEIESRTKSAIEVAGEARQKILESSDKTKKDVKAQTNGKTTQSETQQFGNLQVVNSK